jgi:hypothetical protein
MVNTPCVNTPLIHQALFIDIASDISLFHFKYV